ncbi:MAG: NusG domain II-containing protein [Enterococcus casseliflavus]
MKKTIQPFLKLLKPYDYLLFVLLVVGSFLPLFLFEAQAQSDTGDRYAIVRINGEEVDRFNLEEIDAMELSAEGQGNIVEIKDGAIEFVKTIVPTRLLSKQLDLSQWADEHLPVS